MFYVQAFVPAISSLKKFSFILFKISFCPITDTLIIIFPCIMFS